MSERKVWMGALVMVAFCIGPGIVGQARCEEVLVKGVPYIVQKAHLD